MASSQPPSSQVDSGDDEMMAQPQVFDLMTQLDQIRRDTNRPMTTDEQAEVLGEIIDRQEAQKRADREAIMTEGDAQFDEAAMEEAVRALKRQRTDSDSTRFDLHDARKVYAYGPEDNPERVADDAMLGLALDTELLSLSDGFEGEFSGAALDMNDQQHPDSDGPAYVPGFNILDSVCSSIWLATEVGKHLRPRDIVNLFSVSRSFHDIVRQHWQSTIIAWGEHMAPSSLKIFFWKFYARHAIQDPTGTTWAAPGPFTDRFPRPAWAGPERPRACDANVRLVPGLRYLAMIAEREARVRDILACLARAGHRMPRGAHRALKKVWLLMDIGTNGLRRDFVRSEALWAREDLYAAQLFFVKLQMRLNEPCFGPDCPALAEALLGARDGLSPLWAVLRGKACSDLVEVVQMRARYHCGPAGQQGQGAGAGAGGGDPAARHRDGWLDYFGVPAWDLGFDHLEGWGEGSVHLSRPDELVVEEAVRRGINLQDHLVFMVLWGHVDWARRRNLVPSEEEMYMSDDELPPLKRKEGPAGVLQGRCGNVPFERGNWLPVHALKARWDTLTDEEKRAVNEADAADDIKMLPWDDDDEGFFDPDEVAGQAAGRHESGLHDDDYVCENCGMLHDGDNDEVCCDDVEEEEEKAEDLGGDITAAPAAVTDPTILAMWDTLTPGQKDLIADAHKQRLAGLAGSGTGTGTGTAPRDPTRSPYPRDYRISDPTCLSLLRRYDVFPHEMFSSAGKNEEENDGGDDAHKSGDEDGSEGWWPPGDDDEDDDSDDEYGDDEALKALADEEYSDEDADEDEDMFFDVAKYKSYLAEAREDRARLHDDSEEEEANGSGDAHEADMEGIEVDIPMKVQDTRYC